MKAKEQMRWLGVVLVALLGFATGARAAIIWSEDFSDVSEWQVIFDPGGGSTITSSGGLGLFHVPNAGTETAFGPNPFVAPLVPFAPPNKNDYAMDVTVDSLTGSTSYDIRLDEFDSGTNYLSTVFGVFPQGTFTGPTNILLGGFTYSNSTAFLLPKITVFTGDGDQTVKFDSMDFTVVPEPTTMFLVTAGLALLGIKGILGRKAR